MSFPQTQLSNNIQSSILLKFIPDFEGSRTVEKECGLSPLNELTLTASAVKRQFGTFMNPEDFAQIDQMLMSKTWEELKGPLEEYILSFHGKSDSPILFSEVTYFSYLWSSLHSYDLISLVRLCIYGYGYEWSFVVHLINY